MNTLLYRFGAVMVALPIGLFSQNSFAAAADQVEQSNIEDISVQARGPVHEAYAEPVEATARPGLVVPKQPPQPIPEQPPDQKPEGDNVQWMPGYWGWDSDRQDFLWVSGFWRVPPPDRKWVPGYWTKVEDGWQWVSGFWASASQDQLQYQEEPPASLDYGPTVAAPDADSIYVPGCWVYRSVRYFWRPGYWMEARPGFCWTPAHFCYTPSGYVFVDGYWDYAPADRGLLFAPVCFNGALWTDPSWFYQPSYCVSWPALLGSLFVRPDYCHYYFGDYYGPSYARLGFAPWFAWGRRYHDPLFSYYDWANGGDPGWYRGLRSNYISRYNGDLARPPRTFGEQNALIHNIHDQRISNIDSLRVVQPLNQIQNSRFKLARLNKTQLNEQRNIVKNYQNLSLNRQRLESPGRSLIGRSGGPSLSGIPSGRPIRGNGLNTTSPRTNNRYPGIDRPADSRTLPNQRGVQGPANRRQGLNPPLRRPDRTYRPGTPDRTGSRYQPSVGRPANDRMRSPYQQYRGGRQSTQNPPAQNYRAPAYTAPRTPARVGPTNSQPRSNAYRPASAIPNTRGPAATYRSPAPASRAPSRPAAAPRPTYRPPPARAAPAPRSQAPAYRPPARPAAAPRPANHPAPARATSAPRPQPRPAPAPHPAPNHKR